MIRRFTLRPGQTGRKYTSIKLAHGQRERGELHAILIGPSIEPWARCKVRREKPNRLSHSGVSPRCRSEELRFCVGFNSLFPGVKILQFADFIRKSIKNRWLRPD